MSSISWTNPLPGGRSVNSSRNTSWYSLSHSGSSSWLFSGSGLLSLRTQIGNPFFSPLIKLLTLTTLRGALPFLSWTWTFFPSLVRKETIPLLQLMSESFWPSQTIPRIPWNFPSLRTRNWWRVGFSLSWNGISTVCSFVRMSDPLAKETLSLWPVGLGFKCNLLMVLGERNECELPESMRKERVLPS